MPPNESCPSCGGMVADWHREWDTRQDQAKIVQGTAGMECRLCGTAVMHGQWLTPLTLPPPGGQVEKVARDVIQAAYWAVVNAGKPLEDYLRTREGQPYARLWS